METISSRIRNYFSPDARLERKRAKHIEADSRFLNEFLPEDATAQIESVKNVMADAAIRHNATVSFFDPAKEYGEERKPYIGGCFVPQNENFPSNEIGVKIVQPGRNRDITFFVPCEAEGKPIEGLGKRMATELMHTLGDKEETLEEHITKHSERRASYIDFSKRIGSEKALELYKKTLMDMAKTIR